MWVKEVSLKFDHMIKYAKIQCHHHQHHQMNVMFGHIVIDYALTEWVLSFVGVVVGKAIEIKNHQDETTASIKD